MPKVPLQPSLITKALSNIFPNDDHYFQTLWNITPDAMLIADREGMVIDANPAYLQLCGHPREQVVGHSFTAILPGSRREAALAEYADMFTRPGSPSIFTTTIQRPDGTVRTVEPHISFIEQDGRRNAIFAVVRDVTKYERQANILQMLESVVGKMGDGVLITETDPLSPPGPRIVYVNPALTNTMGYSREELLGQSPRLFQGPKTDRQQLDQIREALEKQLPINVELINYTKAGQEVWLELAIAPVKDENGHTTHFVAVQKDVTARKQLEETLELSQKRYHMATQATRVGIWDWDIQTNEAHLDPAYKAMLGYDVDEIPDHIASWRDLLHPDDRQSVMEEVLALITGQGMDYKDEHRMICKDGSHRWVMVRGQVIRNEQGQPLRMLGTSTDITDRKNAEILAQRQYKYAQALSAFKQTLLGPTRNEADQQRLLTEALHHLLKPTQARVITLRRNIDDPELGLYSQLLAMASSWDADPAANGMETVDPMITDFAASLKALIPALAKRSDDFITSIIPWSTVTPEFTRNLANGHWQSGYVTDLYSTAPQIRDFLIQKHHIDDFLLFPIHLDNHWWGTISIGRWGATTTQAEDEILSLSNAINVLVITLQRWQAEAALLRMNDRLEDQVRKRTIELSDTVQLLQQEVKERTQAEAELQNVLSTLEGRVADRTQELTAFFNLIILSSQTVNPDDIFQGTVNHILEVTQSQIICIHLLTDNRQELHLAAHLNLDDDALQRLQRVEVDPEFQHWFQQTNDPIISAHLIGSGIIPSVFHLTDQQVYLGTQIRVGNQIKGLLSCYRFVDHGFALDEISLVVALAGQLAMVLEAHRLRHTTAEMAVLEERHRLARDLHDSVTQSIFSLTLLARSAREATEDGDTDRLNQSLHLLEQNTTLSLREMRLLLYELRPANLAQEGLAQAIALRLNTVEKRAGLQLNIQLDDFPALPPIIETELYYIIIEALNNVIKHALATTLTLHLNQVDEQIKLEITDNGRGFDPEQTSNGLGLKHIRERITRLGGQVSITSRRGQGTRLMALIPCKMEEGS